MELRRIQLLYQAIKLFKHVSQVLQIILRAGWIQGEDGQCTICTDWIFRWNQVIITLAKPFNIHRLFYFIILKLIAKIDKKGVRLFACLIDFTFHKMNDILQFTLCRKIKCIVLYYLCIPIELCPVEISKIMPGIV